MMSMVDGTEYAILLIGLGVCVAVGFISAVVSMIRKK